MKVGVFGGTFNPPHLGHLIIAEFVRDDLGLERIFFVPTALPPHKKDLDIVEAHHRLAMVEHALQGNRRMVVSDLEIQRGGLSFTVDTLAEFHRLRPDDQLYLLIGMDNYVEFHTWKSPETILRLATLVVMRRPGAGGVQEVGRPSTNTLFCEVPEIGIASRDIRKRVQEGKSIRYLVPAAVERYIVKHHLYREAVE